MCLFISHSPLFPNPMTSQRTDAKPQMSLLLKDIVETEKESRTKLFFNDDSILNLGELSRVEVEEYLYSSEKKRSKSIYRLIEGSLKVVVGRSDLEIHTPTAVAAARGTKFIIWAEEIDGSKGTCLMVSDGEVVVKSNRADVKGSVTVTSDKMTCVPAFRPPDPVIFIGASGQEKFARSTSVMGGISENKVRLFEKISLKSPVRRMKALKKMGVDKIPPIIQETKGSLTPVNIELVFPD